MNKIYILSDGKPGHLNQSLGIAEYLDNYQTEIIPVTSKSEGWAWLQGQRKYQRQHKLHSISADSNSQTLVIGAGSKTQLWLVLAKYLLGYMTIVLMKPNYPKWCFDICFIPEHDYLNDDISRLGSHVYLTKGAPNKVLHNNKKEKDTLLFLIGGPAKAYDFFPDSLLDMIKFIAKEKEYKSITLTTSRRTPAKFISLIKKLNLELELIDGTKTTTEWLPEQLSKTELVWVTEDSVSMVYEALSSGAKVGLLPMPKLQKTGRIAQGLEILINENYLVTYMDYIERKHLVSSPQSLQEAQRCAQIISQYLSS